MPMLSMVQGATGFMKRYTKFPETNQTCEFDSSHFFFFIFAHELEGHRVIELLTKHFERLKILRVWLGA